MATVLRVGGFQFIIRTDDHAPAHVHVRTASGWAKIELPNQSRAARVVPPTTMRVADVRKAVRIVEENAELLHEKWKEIHG